MNTYSIDKVRFCSIADLDELSSATKQPAFKELFNGRISTDKAEGVTSFRYNSWLSGRPQKGVFFITFCERLGEFGGTLTGLEITCDTRFDSEEEAVDAYLQQERTAYLAYGNGAFVIFDSPPWTPGFFDGKELCLGQRGHFQLVIYARPDKATKQHPVLRREWRITGNSLIRKLFNVDHERDLPNPKTLFQILEKKYYRVGELNQNKIASLMKYRSVSLTMSRTTQFRQFLHNERLNGNNQTPRYRKKIKKQFSYFIEKDKI